MSEPPDLHTLLAERNHFEACTVRLRQTVAELTALLDRRKDEDIRHLQRGSTALALLARCREAVTDPTLVTAIDAVLRGD